MEKQNLRQITQKELQEILEQHKLWLETIFNVEKKGKCADLRGANLSYANLSGANLSYANLGGVNLSCANLSGVNLSYANLSGAKLRGANLSCANLSGANLSYADLSCANLSDANLSYANLSGANLRGANLSCTNLSGASLSCANLCGVTLSCANLRGANFDFSCFPLWCGSLDVHIDDKQAIQLLYHLVRNVQYSENTSAEIKALLIQPQNIDKANQFHRVEKCGKIKLIKV